MPSAVMVVIVSIRAGRSDHMRQSIDIDLVRLLAGASIPFARIAPPERYRVAIHLVV